MGCNASCAITANAQDIVNVIEAVKPFLSGDISGKNLDAEARAGALRYFFPASELDFSIEQHGENYAIVFQTNHRESALIPAVYESILSKLPAGHYGIAFTFAWDFDPLFTCLNWSNDLFLGDGAPLPEFIYDIDVDYLDENEREELLHSDGWRIKDMAELDLNNLAQAVSVNRWSKPAQLVAEETLDDDEDCIVKIAFYDDPDEIEKLWDYVERLRNWLVGLDLDAFWKECGDDLNVAYDIITGLGFSFDSLYERLDDFIEWAKDEEVWACLSKKGIRTNDEDKTSFCNVMRWLLVSEFPNVGMKGVVFDEGMPVVVESEPGSDIFEESVPDFW